MAYDQKLEKRLAKIVEERRDFQQQKMFGGVGFLLRGNMCFGIWKDNLILRLGEANAGIALKKKNTVPFDITGRAMKGWVMAKPQGLKGEAALKEWIDQAIGFVSQLPRK
ncbi:MAG TPA: TfoX/Sxy family protein [Candidatus Omnitrophota bacterium]|nr:TfoX/Sxy family protein [Candidatus Omnitrophota bacterium]